MQVKIDLLNNFYGTKEQTMQSKLSQNLTIEEATAIYEFLHKILIKLEDKGRPYWVNKQRVPQTTYGLVLKEAAKEETNGLADEEWDGMWYIGD